MNHIVTHFRFAGRIWENMRFEKTPGWETERVAQTPNEGDGTFIIELLTNEEHVITSVSPQVDFSRMIVEPPLPEMKFAIVLAYVPADPQGRKIVFRRGDFVIHREMIAKEPPFVRIEDVTIQNGDRVTMRWSAEHPEGRSLTYNIVYLVSNQRTFLVARNLDGISYTADLSPFPGSQEARLAVLATDGTRSAFDVSEPFLVNQKPPQVWIQSPRPNEIVPADQPVSLSGQALNVAGASLPADGLIWRVNGDLVARDSRLAFTERLEPGQHDITLEYVLGKDVVAKGTVTIDVANRSAEQQRFIEVMRELEQG